MQIDLQKIKTKALALIEKASDLLELDKIELAYFARKGGELTEILKSLKNLSAEDKKAIGELANQVKTELTALIARKREELDNKNIETLIALEKIDLSQPGEKVATGSLHPLTIIQQEIEDIFCSLGFVVLDGPEIESDYYNFEALNIPPHHPARDMQDTFYVKSEIRNSKSEQNSKFKIQNSKLLLRTHTSPVQIRAMQRFGAPLRAIMPGRVFRNEATDSRHEHTFLQLEGLMIDRDISFAHLKGVLEFLVKRLYGEKTKLRMRPKYYPFVEPGANYEVTCFLCEGRGCRVCKGNGWLEIGGSGMVHPNVLRAGGIDPEKYSGFAFGFGLTRLAMLRYGVDDVRLMSSGDLRFLEQF